jgi:murein DD-endopeptidase MepM/ murein hydrolase activator NlpD
VSVPFCDEDPFIGVDVEDARGPAIAFLRRFPVSYPSYFDHGQDIARSLQASGYYPQTVYLDRHGRLVIDHGGSYVTAATLEHDVRRYALQ